MIDRINTLSLQIASLSRGNGWNPCIELMISPLCNERDKLHQKIEEITASHSQQQNDNNTKQEMNNKMELNIAKHAVTGIMGDLTKAAIHREVITTYDDQRCVGKTTGLIEFARLFDLHVVVNTNTMAEALQSEHKYDKIVSVLEAKNMARGLRPKFVFDEYVDHKLFPTETIVTGYVNGRA